MNAHHPHDNYQIGQTIQVEGFITELRFRNPDIWRFIEVDEANNETGVWGSETDGIAQFKRAG